jgi:hypothetical protein
MALIKIQRFFGAVPNELLNNPDISFKAKGLYAYLNSKPDNWDFSVEGIASQVKEGIDSVRAGIHELEKFGYLKRVKYQNEKGFWEIDYMLFEDPTEEESYLGKSNEGEHPKQYKKEDIKKEYNTKEKIVKKKEFVPPTYEEVKAFFIENQEPLEKLDKCFTYYNDANWTNRDGKKVKDWKRTIKTNWFSKNKNRDGHHNVPPAAPSRKLHESFNFKITNNDI